MASSRIFGPSSDKVSADGGRSSEELQIHRAPPVWLRLGEVEDKVYDVSADARTRWGRCSARSRVRSREHRWARKDKVDSHWECSAEELRGDGADVHRETGVPVMYGLRWEEMWELVFQIRDALRGSRVRVRFCVDPSVGSDHVTRTK